MFCEHRQCFFVIATGFALRIHSFTKHIPVHGKKRFTSAIHGDIVVSLASFRKALSPVNPGIRGNMGALG